MPNPGLFRTLRAGATLTLGVAVAAFAAAQAQPVAPVRPVTTDYYGTPFVDNYRYMENLADPEVKAWMKAQADATRAKLDAIPGHAALQQRIHELMNADLRRGGFVRRGNRYFYEVTEPSAQLPKLYYRDGLPAQEHLLLDPPRWARARRRTTRSDFYQPSNDGKLLAYGISAGGSEQGVLHVMDVATGKVHAEAIDRTADAAVGWRPDNKSFFYMRYNAAGPNTPATDTKFNARTYLHQVDTRASRRRRRGGLRPRREAGAGRARRAKAPTSCCRPIRRTPWPWPTTTWTTAPATVYVAPLAQVTRRPRAVEEGRPTSPTARRSSRCMARRCSCCRRRTRRASSCWPRRWRIRTWPTPPWSSPKAVRC